LIVVAVASLVACRGDREAAGLLAGRDSSAVSNVTRAELVNDGAAAEESDSWDADVAAVFGGAGAFVEFDLGEVVPIAAVWLQADANDRYEISTSVDRETFRILWWSPPAPGGGLQTRFVRNLEGSARWVRIQARGGDGRYSVAEVGLFSIVPDTFPPRVVRRAGMPPEERLRTSFLMLGLALILWVGVGKRAGSVGWLAVLALAAFAGWSAIDAARTIWPIPPRGVALARSVIAAVAAFTILWEAYAPRRFAPDPRTVLGVLAICGALGVASFYGLGAPQFHDHRANRPTFVHWSDLRQYVAPAKYFPEIGFWRIYEADVLAYAEDTGRSLDSLAGLQIRDLRTNAPTVVGTRRQAIEEVKERFTPARWEDYKRDARMQREVMGERDWLVALMDLGGNATPVWMSVAHLLFNAAPTEPRMFAWMALLDPLLFAILFYAIGRTFGLRTMLVAMTIFGANDFIMYGSNWAGAVLRHDWLVMLGLGICALASERWILGGVLLGVSTSIRAFPALAVVGLSLPALWWIGETWRERGRPPGLVETASAQRPTLVAGLASVATVLVLALVSSLILGFESWAEWLAKVSLLDAQPHPNPVSLKSVIAGTDDARDRLFAARWPIYAFAAAGYVGMVALAARRRRLHEAAALGLVLVPVLLFPSNYYIHLVTLLPLAAADAIAWSVLLALCAAQYFTTLVPDLRLHFYLSSVLLMTALAAILVRLLQKPR
jgi:hypothetical protein